MGKMNDRQRAIFKMRGDGFTFQAIGDKFNISRQGAWWVVKKICKNELAYFRLKVMHNKPLDKSLTKT